MGQDEPGELVARERPQRRPVPPLTSAGPRRDSPPRTAAEVTAARRPDASMSLLVDAVAGALDPSYAQARARTERRAARAAAASAPPPPPPATGRRRATRPAGPPTTRPLERVATPEPLDEPAPPWRVAPWLVLALLGLVTGLAVAQVRHSQSGATRTDLLTDVRVQTRQADALERQAADLRAQLEATRATALATQAEQRSQAQTVLALQAGAGTSALTGPGLVVTLSDAPGSAAAGSGRGGQLASDRVFDSDLQAVTNALWASGAEAISVNSLRLTAQTAIRAAGEAILVDFRALSSPYVVQALGDPRSLEQAFAADPASLHLTDFSTQYGLGFTTQRAARLSVPAGSAAPLRHATPVTAGQP